MPKLIYRAQAELEKAEIEETLAEVDENDDGKLDFGEFMKLMKQSASAKRQRKFSQLASPNGGAPLELDELELQAPFADKVNAALGAFVLTLIIPGVCYVVYSLYS